MLTRLLTRARLAWSQGAARWPSQCLVCHAWPAQTLCHDCVSRFNPAQLRCEGCALPLAAGVARCGACLRDPPPMDLCLAALPYAWPWSRCIARFKFEQDPGLALPLAALLRGAPGVPEALAAADMVLPLPLSAQRLAERGYNPAQCLAQGAAPDKLALGVLLRTRHTPPQHELPRAQRLRSVRGVFALDARHAPRLRGQRVLILDDVMTTGATLREAARVVREAGAAHVTALALARTPPHA